MAVLSVRPGITSPASLAYFDESSLLTGADWEQTYVERIMPAKLNIELEYLKTRSLFADVRIILRTVFH
jgi:lipopolysaccharide/colanic/teichoic acid biosynthesis glycosyltransferase